MKDIDPKDEGIGRISAVVPKLFSKKGRHAALLEESSKVSASAAVRLHHQVEDAVWLKNARSAINV